MSTTTLLSPLILVIGLWGCTPHEVIYEQEQLERGTAYYHRIDSKLHSEAINIALATGLTNQLLFSEACTPLKDTVISQDEYQKLQAIHVSDKSFVNMDTVVNATHFALINSGLISGSLLNSGLSMGLLALSINNRPRHPSSWHKILAWMPSEYAKDKNDAVAKLTTLIVHSYLKVLPEPYTAVQIDDNTIEVFGHHKCSDENKRCLVKILANPPIITKKTPNIFSHSGSSFYWGVYPLVSMGALLTDQNGNELEYIPDLETNEIYFSMSQYLPEWVYFYRAPVADPKIPLMINKGRILYFVKTN